MFLMLLLLYFQLRKKVDKPFKLGMISVDPKEVHFPQVEQAINVSIHPVMIAVRTRYFTAQVSVHN